ncbi:MAG: competence protein TfoX [Clostridiales bacterium]|nr:competence protein TfoX [Clostridiales bacterium]
MASSIEYRDFILEQLSSLGDITCKPMMGEYLLYYKGVLFGGIYDDRFLVKKTSSNSKYNMDDAIPYDGAKIMYLVDDVDNQDSLKDIVEETYKGLIKK